MVKVKALLNQISHPQLCVAQALPQREPCQGLLCNLPDTSCIYFHTYVNTYEAAQYSLVSHCMILCILLFSLSDVSCISWTVHTNCP